ncbi:MAG: MXAN_5187 C-terminal domain-containing protein [Pseudomonadota bacterium]
MPRVKVGLMALIVIAAISLTAYVLSTRRLEARIVADVQARVTRAAQLLLQNDSLEGLALMKRTEGLARDHRFSEALDEPEVVSRAKIADAAIQEFRKQRSSNEREPDFIAIVNKRGDVSAMQDVPRPDPEPWGATYAAVKAALEKGQVSKDIWDYRGGVMRVGIAPIYDTAQDGGIAVKGALIMAYALNAQEAQTQAKLLGMDVGYFVDNHVRATSFRRGGAEEDVSKQKDLESPLFGNGLAAAALDKGQSDVARVKLDREEFVTMAARLPLNFANKSSGAMVLMSLSRELEPIGGVGTTILLVGLGGLVVAILAMLLTARMLLNPAEEIEAGVTEIINGNLDFTFKPAGADLDGLANALNVMLARLLGRPEPGEEEVDENGNVPARAKVTLDMEETGSAAALGGQVSNDPDIVALAQEEEPDYYRRTFTEFMQARRTAGERVDGVTFEEFVAKLRLNEANLTQKYNCRAVRFRVQNKNGQISLKPVPIL